MHIINIILLNLLLYGKITIQLPLPNNENEEAIKAFDNQEAVIASLKRDLERLDNVKGGIIDSIGKQENGIKILDQMIQGPAKDMEDVQEIREDAIKRTTSSAKLAKSLISIIESVVPFMSEKINEIIRCKNDSNGEDDKAKCLAYTTSAKNSSLNTVNFIDKRFSSIIKDEYIIQNTLNELSARFQTQQNPHSREDIIGAHKNNFEVALSNIETYRLLVEEKKKQISLEAEQIASIRTSCVRSLKAIKRLDKIEAGNLQTKLTHEYMFLKHTENDIYGYLGDVMYVLDKAKKMVNDMYKKFDGDDKSNLVVSDIVDTLDQIDEILENVVFTFSEDGHMNQAIMTFKVSAEKNRRLVESANKFVDDLLISRNRDVFKPFKKPFEYLTIKNVSDSIKLLNNAKDDVEDKISKIAELVDTEESIFKALDYSLTLPNDTTTDNNQNTKFCKILRDIGNSILNKSKIILDDINSLLILHKYDQTLMYMSNCLNEHIEARNLNRDKVSHQNANDLSNSEGENDKLNPSKDCKESFRLLWNLNDKHSKSKIEKAIAEIEKKHKAQQILLIISILLRESENPDARKGETTSENVSVAQVVAMKNPKLENLLDNVSAKQLEKMLELN